MLGDNVTGQGLEGFVKKFENEKLDALIILKEVDNPSAFGIANWMKKATSFASLRNPKPSWETSPSSALTCFPTKSMKQSSG